MSFVAIAALLVGLLAAGPIVAHLLRRGRTQEVEFPPIALVPRTAPTSRERRRVDDRLLLLLRTLTVLALAILGATPLVECSRLSVARTSGASVALAIVLDDSHSMRSRVEGGTRWELAKTGAEQLLASTRSGDSIAIVLAGRPARVALSPTTDRDTARNVLSGLTVSDRATDLSDAVRLARSGLRDLPQLDKRVVVLGDLAGDGLPFGEPPAFAPLTDLTQVAPNCALTSCVQSGNSVAVDVACNATEVARGRELQLDASSKRGIAVAEGGSAGNKAEPALGKDAAVAVAARGGLQTVTLAVAEGTDGKRVALSGSDSDPSDDSCTVGRSAVAPSVAIVVDRARASTVTGGPTVVEQALSAVRPGVALRPLTLAPESSEDLQSFVAVVFDDPAGLPPEARTALTDWVHKGGVVIAFLGPQTSSAQLASNLSPFVEGAALWEALATPGTLKPESVAWLNQGGPSLEELNERGRAVLGRAVPEGARVRGEWQDGQPWLLERRMGQGVVLTVGLPASVAISDLALRPGFLSLFDYLLRQSETRSGPGRSVAGATWRFPRDAKVSVKGPAGALQLSSLATCAEGDSACEAGHAFKYVDVDRAGSYEVIQGSNTQERSVDLDPVEILAAPLDASSPTAATAAWSQSAVDASPQLALVVLCLFAIELLVRSVRKRREAS